MMKLTKRSYHCESVNLYVKDTGKVMDVQKIENSYFITVDDEHNIIDSEPPLKS